MADSSSDKSNLQGAAEASNEDLLKGCLEHYERVATAGHEWNNQVPQAIRAWYAARASAPSASEATGETPRTDALMMSINPDGPPLPVGDMTHSAARDFCRQLERELAAAKAEAKRWENHYGDEVSRGAELSEHVRSLEAATTRSAIESPQESPLAWVVFTPKDMHGNDYYVFPDEHNAQRKTLEDDGNEMLPLYRARAFARPENRIHAER